MTIEIIFGKAETTIKNLAANSIDLIIADPPFNVNKKYAGKNGTDNMDRQKYYEWLESWVEECYRVLKPTGSFYHMTLDRHLEKALPIMGKYGVYINIIKWRNVSASHNKRGYWESTQPIMFYGKTKDYKFNTYAQTRPVKATIPSWSPSRGSRGQLLDYWPDIPYIYAGSIIHKEAVIKPGTNSKEHVAQMPINLSDRFILFSTDENDTILDPFSGSGTAAISCIKLRRNYIGIEKEKKYIDLINRRIAKERQQIRFNI